MLSLGLAVLRQRTNEEENAKMLFGFGRNWLSERDTYIRGVGIRLLRFVVVRYPNSRYAFNSRDLLTKSGDRTRPVPRDRPSNGRAQAGWFSSSGSWARYWSISLVPTQK